MTPEPIDMHSEKTLSDLAALADGSLAPERREDVLRGAEASPEQTQALAEQRRMVALLSSTRPAAPASVHRAIHAMADAELKRHADHRVRSPRRLRWRVWSLVGASAVTAAAILAITLLLPSGEQSSLTFGQAAALGLQPATVASPAEDPHDHAVLTSTVDGIPYPYWGKRFGWKTEGARTDKLRGRLITTVFYRNARAERIGYSIVAGRAIAIPKSKVLKRDGRTYWVLNAGPATILTWRRAGHTCILTSGGVDSQTLLALARWHAS